MAIIMMKPSRRPFQGLRAGRNASDESRKFGSSPHCLLLRVLLSFRRGRIRSFFNKNQHPLCGILVALF